MVALDQNLLYIFIAVFVAVIILIALILRRRRSREGPSNVNQYLESEADAKKVKLVERKEGFQTRTPLYQRRPSDDISDIREKTSNLQHQNLYHNQKIEEKTELLESRKKLTNHKRQVKGIKKKFLELNSPAKPKKGK